MVLAGVVLALSVVTPGRASASEVPVDKIISSLAAGVLGGAAALGLLISTTTNHHAATDQEKRDAIAALIANHPDQLRAEIALGAGPVLTDLAAVYDLTTNEAVESFGRALRDRREDALKAIDGKDSEALMQVITIAGYY